MRIGLFLMTFFYFTAFADEGTNDNFFDNTFNDFYLTCEVTSQNVSESNAENLKSIEITSSLNGRYLFSTLTFQNNLNHDLKKQSHRLRVTDPGTSENRVVNAILNGNEFAPSIKLSYFEKSEKWFATLGLYHPSCSQQLCGFYELKCQISRNI